MKTISAEEANEISCSNNAGVIERNKEIQKTIEDCMARIEGSARAGDFRAKCYCRVKHLDDTFAILKSLDYEATTYRCPDTWHTRYPFSTSMIEFEVSWNCFD
jgi:hypothetical protein